jgi:hypothetical protein
MMGIAAAAKMATSPATEYHIATTDIVRPQSRVK